MIRPGDYARCLQLLSDAHRPECPATCGKLVNRPKLSIGRTAILPTP